MKTLTYGVIPSKDEFIAAFERECPEGHFQFGNDRRMGNQALCCAVLWREVCEAALETNDSALQWASDVLYVLGFEWV